MTRSKVQTIEWDLNEWMQWGVSTADKTLYLGSSDRGGPNEEAGIDYQLAERAIKGIYVLDRIEPKGRPLNVIINSIGGDVLHGLAIYDALKACQSKVIVQVYGQVMSMGSVILQAADKREMAKNSRLMIHPGVAYTDGTSSNIRSWLTTFDLLDQLLFTILLEKLRAKNKSFPEERLRHWLTKDTIFTAQQAVDLGLADSLI